MASRKSLQACRTGKLEAHLRRELSIYSPKKLKASREHGHQSTPAIVRATQDACAGRRDWDIRCGDGSIRRRVCEDIRRRVKTRTETPIGNWRKPRGIDMHLTSSDDRERQRYKQGRCWLYARRTSSGFSGKTRCVSCP